MNRDEITYKLSRHVPDMQQRAFNIQTSYGELDIPQGPLADAITKLVQKHLEAELDKLDRAQS